MEIDLAQYFVDTASLAVLVATLVAFVKKHLIASLDGFWTVIASVVVGAVLGVCGRFLGLLDATIVQALLFGGSAGVVASGGWDLIAGLLGKSRPELEE